MGGLRIATLTLVLGVGLQPPANAQSVPSPSDGPDLTLPDSAPYFYRGFPYGSEAYIGPLDVILNKGFAKTQVSQVPREIFQATYGFGVVWDAIANPIESIERSGGWKKFFTEEVLPITFDPSDLSGLSWDAYPNYAGHLIEGGIVYRRLAEWFEAHGVPVPRLLAGVTSMAASALNEAYDRHGPPEGTGDVVADIYLFDLGGVFLFSSDRVARFFARRLNATVWTGQASVTVPGLALVNNGDHLILKPPLPFIPNTSLFFRTGLGLHVGLSVHRSDGYSLSLGVGAETAAEKVDPETGDLYVEADPSAALHLDRHNSLLASLAWSEREDRLLSLNLYPGIVDFFGIRTGWWAVLTAEHELQVGIVASSWLGGGFGFGR